MESSEFFFEPGCQARSSPPRKCHLMDNPSPIRPLAICRAGPARRGVQPYICACGSKGCLFVPHSQPAHVPPPNSSKGKSAPTPPHPIQSWGTLLQPLFLNTACLRRGVPFGEERSWGRDLRGKSEDYRGIVTFLSLSPSSTPSQSNPSPRKWKFRITMRPRGRGSGQSFCPSPTGFSIRKTCGTPLSPSLPWSPFISAELLLPLPRPHIPGRRLWQVLKASQLLPVRLGHGNKLLADGDSHRDPRDQGTIVNF